MRLFVAQQGARVFAITAAALKQIDLLDEKTGKPEGNPVDLTEEDLQEVFGDAGRWHDLELLPPSFDLQEEAKAKALVEDEQGGFRLDQKRLAGARAALAVKGWDELLPQLQEPPVESFGALHPNIANAIDSAILAHMYPSMYQHEDFIAALKRKRQRSGANG